MQQTQHSRGPWIICTMDDRPDVLSIEQDREAIGEEPSVIGEIDLAGDGIDEEIGWANARLIIAAPDMLEALEEIVKGDIPERMRDIASIAIRKAKDKTNAEAET